ncbi:hypothetical protein SAMN02745823_02902 [Sporobacter termitidis DSM 10068]|uniref:Phosphatidylglycerol lysyltransferase C-terminal domain-containing protein n=1 Tax=Sporobacter termitidis DSM 10068 TaxID=1123282 RepID=A0A1M5YWJ1_9FIRM|nr:phosphatidylglycerol lysyltransferase domain-containing protein [Sporobacter termitidis]SHI16210.1 hypothetical protein SAMN02745823_02902 [Sporobacter termitidis DSM 10068]
MDFKTLSLSHIDLLRPYFSSNLCRICDCTIGGTFIWRDLFNTEFAIVDRVLYLKVRYLTGDIAFTPPRGEIGAEKETYDRIISFSREIGCPPRLCAVSSHRLERIKEYYPNAKAYTDRAWTDYLYLSEDIRDLSGRRYSGQRNHINKFLREYPDWTFEQLGSGNLRDVRDFFESYAKEHIKDYAAYDEGNIKTLEVLDNLEHYGMFGGVLKARGQVVGASLGETVGDTLFVHIEKSLTEYNGSYPMLVNQFAKMFAVGDVAHINREEDDGVEGLRTSKLSYHPTALLDKYVVELE